jgi:hypothetical protein
MSVDFSNGIRGRLDTLTWYVRIDHHIVGWVIAENKEAALKAAQEKFQPSFENDFSVEQKRRKRDVHTS